MTNNEWYIIEEDPNDTRPSFDFDAVPLPEDEEVFELQPYPEEPEDYF